jgi:hypothetical protein
LRWGTRCKARDSGAKAMTEIHRTQWTPQLEQRLRELYHDTRTADVATALGLPLKPVQAKAAALGLRKSHALIVEMARQRASDPGHPTHAYRWQPGTPPWNAGVKGVIGTHPNTRAHQFQAGNKPHTWVPVGTYRVTGGMLEIKYADDSGPSRRRWRPLAAHVWIQANGPIPGGHLVVFKPGRATLDPQRITLDAVELITRRENMDRNSMHRLPKPVMQAIHTRGVLNRQINRLTKDLAQQPHTQEPTP